MGDSIISISNLETNGYPVFTQQNLASVFILFQKLTLECP